MRIVVSSTITHEEQNLVHITSNERRHDMASDDDILIVSGGFQMDASQQSIAETAAQFDDSIDNSKDLPYNAAHSSMFGSGQEAHHVGAGALNLSTMRSISNNLMHWQVASYPYWSLRSTYTFLHVRARMSRIGRASPRSFERST